MDNKRLPKKAYNMLCDLDNRDKSNLASKIRLKLFSLGFGHVWLQQNAGNQQQFVQTLRRRLIDCRWQEWTSHVESSDRFYLYRQLNLAHCIPAYLSIKMDRQFKYIMTKFRFGISDLLTHYYRYRKHRYSDLMCPLCKTSIDNEVHFVLCCPALNDLRERFIPAKYYRHPCLFRFILLMSTTNEIIVKRLGLFLYRAFKIRSILTS